MYLKSLILLTITIFISCILSFSSCINYIIQDNSHISENPSFETKFEDTRSQSFDLYAKLEKSPVEKLLFVFKYNETDDMWIEFKKCGINSIMSISAIYLAPNMKTGVDPDFSRKTVTFMKAYTDFIGPYIVSAKNNGDSGSPSFTGGWHGSNGNETGNPTARTISVKVKTDSSYQAVEGVIPCYTAEIHVTNLIQGYNTKQQHREILLENVYYGINNGRIDVRVETEALEDVSIQKYYGLQIQNNPWNQNISFRIEKTKTTSENMLLTKIEHANRYYPTAEKLIINATYGKHRLEVWIDPTYGMGKMKYISGDKPYAFSFKPTKGSGKSYFNLINGLEFSLPKDCKMYWHGGYVFSYK
ncbi:MAG: hypothetical protein N3I35_14320 [Clostridia bacterium]|nr:hypothetical protein [Clostridia bacterium]